MNNSEISTRWQQFLSTLSRILDINIAVINGSGNLIISFFKSNMSIKQTDIKNENQLVSDYREFFSKVIDSLDSTPGIFTDPLGLLISITPLNDSNYFVLGGVQEIDGDFNQEEFNNKLKSYGRTENLDLLRDNLVIMTRNTLKSKADNAMRLYNQLLNMTRERDELGHKMMLLTAIEEYDKLLLSLIRLERFELKPILDLIASSLIILFDADGAWVFSHCNDQFCTSFRGNCKKLLQELNKKWTGNICSDKIETTRGLWSAVNNIIPGNVDSETITLKNEKFEGVLGLIKPNSSNVVEALKIFSRMVTIALEIECFSKTLHYRLGHLLKHLRQGVIIYNKKGKVMSLNKTAADFFEERGINLRPGNKLDDYCLDEEIKRAIDSVINNDVDEYFQQESVLECRGNNCYLKWDLVPLKDRDEKNIGAILLFEDTTEINRLKYQIQEQERKAIAGNLAAGFAHEIRNPLSVAGGAIQLLKIIDDPERKNDLINKLRDELDRINQILTEFMGIAKPEQKREFEPVKLPEVLNEIEFLIRSDANMNNVKLTIQEPSDDIPLIKGDSVHLKQVFLNIIKNAIEAMVEGGKLEITYDYSCEYVSISFEDNGPGIPEKHLPLIFRSFFTTKVEGTGLGLSVSSQLIKNMGGELKIESEQGKGTTARLIFPPFQPE